MKAPATFRFDQSEQLSLQIESRPDAALPYRLRPMIPVAGDAPFDDPDWFFEP